jgi:hypothetical protein
MTCILCGKPLPLLPVSNRPRKYCSRACKRFYENHVLRHGRTVEETQRLYATLGTTRPCPVCGRTFVPTYVDGIYCSAKCGSMAARLPGYGLTVDQYRDLQDKAAGKCQMCGAIQTIPLEVDHDHKTGNFRGLVCKSCNYTVGLYEKGLSVTKKELVIKYLERVFKQHHINP